MLKPPKLRPRGINRDINRKRANTVKFELLMYNYEQHQKVMKGISSTGQELGVVRGLSTLQRCTNHIPRSLPC